ncbi:MAG: hypothetical protein AB3N64_11305 [Puniceicoccaceae bacterium]
MNKIKLTTLCGLVSLFSVSAFAEWVLITDFEGAVYDDFDLYKRFAPQGDLYLSGFDPVNAANGHYYADPGPQVDGANNQIWNGFTLPTPVAEGETATLKFDVYLYSTGPFNLNVGLSDIPVSIDDTLSKENGQLLEPNNYGSYESQMGIGETLNARNGSGFTNTGVFSPVGEWFTLYYVADNANDVTYFYYKTAAMSVPTAIPLPDAPFALFRNGTTDPLVTFTITSAGSNSGPIDVFLLDNVYIDTTGPNLDGGTHVGGEFWGGYPLFDESGNVDTGDWLSFINVASDPWIYVYNLSTYVYMPEDYVSGTGSWAYVPNF